MRMTDRSEVRTWSFLALLVGGVLIVVGGAMGALMMGAWGWTGTMAGMMDAYGAPRWGAWMAWWMGGVGILTGGVVLAAAYHVHRARGVAPWGVAAIVAGALSLFARGGYVLGAVAAIAGGALALVDQQGQAPRAGGA